MPFPCAPVHTLSLSPVMELDASGLAEEHQQSQNRCIINYIIKKNSKTCNFEIILESQEIAKIVPNV